jgi:hypothetical protein
MSQTMVKFCSASPGVHFVHERVVEILSEGATLTNNGREKFALGCYKSILVCIVTMRIIFYRIYTCSLLLQQMTDLDHTILPSH